MQKRTEQLVEDLRRYFSQRVDVAFAFLFGSLTKGTERDTSDLDVGVYFYPDGDVWELEDEVFYPEENRIWGDIDTLSGRETDLLVLNRAPCRIVYTVLTEGIPLSIRSYSLYMTILLQAGRQVEEYLEFTDSYLAIKNRSSSLSSLDRERVRRIIDFISSELGDIHQFSSLTYAEYTKNSSLRRNLERWVENLVNGSIDIAKILIASEKQPIPQTYRETLTRIKTFKVFLPEVVDKVAENVRLRNILAHEYLDIRFRYLTEFLCSAESTYKRYIEAARQYVETGTP